MADFEVTTLARPADEQHCQRGGMQGKRCPLLNEKEHTCLVFPGRLPRDMRQFGEGSAYGFHLRHEDCMKAEKIHLALLRASAAQTADEEVP